MTTSSTAPAVAWPPLEGWRTETIPFPLDFAPSLAYTGYEELRFSPEFGKPDLPLFFTYGFLWVVPEGVTLTRAWLEHDLKVYFDGLMSAVAKDKKLPVPAASTVSVADAPPGPDRFAFTATIQTFDAFFTRRPLTLELHVILDVKTMNGWRAHYFEASPNAGSTQVLPALKALRAQLQQ